jgi:hypothetical protein
MKTSGFRYNWLRNPWEKIPTDLQTYRPTYLQTYLPTYLPTYLHTYLPTYLPTYLLTYIPTYLHTYIPQTQKKQHQPSSKYHNIPSNTKVFDWVRWRRTRVGLRRYPMVWSYRADFPWTPELRIRTATRWIITSMLCMMHDRWSRDISYNSSSISTNSVNFMLCMMHDRWSRDISYNSSSISTNSVNFRLW